ncbi:GNAT family N-acetyltransferase [Solihabitans fulvus]|uniref:GNAT family N-acetyltransferase n=1 Tax=Solihabitans fulvus TaxID=1892852 RepID=A0A5B2XF81_9PSEU|nr:GNAT family N-acetyltransferase [Solihabitans fulvus]KAA2261784.1 GNAT family N-acetyltransferase [Solihabitans fulvus]
MTTSTRAIDDRDLDGVLVLNNGAVPSVNELTRDQLAELVAGAAVALVAVDGDEVAGFVLALSPGLPYESQNYRWFSGRYQDFLYVDRVVVAESRRGAGVGGVLYDAVTERARALGAGRVTCEVNVRPPNPGSMCFHERRGFRSVGEQHTENDTKRVALLALPL